MQRSPNIVPSLRRDPPGEKDDGTWLCADGPYRHHVMDSCKLHPSLRLPDPRNRALEFHKRQARASLLSFSNNGRPQRHNFEGAEGPQLLKKHFSNLGPAHQQGSNGTAIRNVYLLEGLNPEFIAIFGQGLQIDPTFFADHERNAAYLGLPHEPSLAPRLPSLLPDSQSFTVGYYDIRAPEKPFQSFNVSCANSGRDVWTTRLSRSWENPVILRQKCSVWVSQSEDDENWSVLILCDPPLTKAHVWSRKHTSDPWQIQIVDVQTRPFQGGFSDFIPKKFPQQGSRCSLGLNRQGLFDDLCYYLTECSQSLPKGMQRPSDATVFARKIVASQYLHLIEYNHAILSATEFPLQRRNTFRNTEPRLLEEQWSDIQLICSRCNRYLKDVSFIMLQLGIPFENPNGHKGTGEISGWTDSAKDFQYIRMELVNLKERSAFLNESLTGLTGIVGNARTLEEARRSIREAKSVKALTIVAMVFIPLTFTTGLFSMEDSHLPGQSLFWTFFAVSVPLIMLVFAVTTVFETGYDSTGSWDFNIFRAKVYELPYTLWERCARSCKLQMVGMTTAMTPDQGKSETKIQSTLVPGKKILRRPKILTAILLTPFESMP